MLNTKFSPWPSFSEEEANAVRDVILSNCVNYWTGQECREFEKEFAVWADSKYAIALTNGTVALDLALIALGVGAGDEVIVTPRTFLASASSIVSVGAKPVFADVDLDSQNITAETIAQVITDKTKAVICVHLAGWPCDMDSIMQLAEKHNFFVVEDCAQAHGAMYKGRSVGSIGHIGAWSFCQDKIMTTGGEGGMVTTNDEALWKAMWSYKDHGKSYDAIYNTEQSQGFNWLHESFGTNWRMLEVQGVIGRIQLTRMAEWTKSRQENSNKITKTAKKYSCMRVPEYPKTIQHAEYKHYLFIEPKNLKTVWTRDKVVAEIVKHGVPCFQGSCSEVYLEKAFDGTGFRPKERLKNAKELGETSIMFLVHPTLTNAEIEKTCEIIDTVLKKASI